MQRKPLLAKVVKLAHDNPELRPLLIPLVRQAALVILTAGGPSYQDYVKEKKRKGEKPLDKAKWESKILGKGKGESSEKKKPAVSFPEGPKNIGPRAVYDYARGMERGVEKIRGMLDKGEDVDPKDVTQVINQIKKWQKKFLKTQDGSSGEPLARDARGGLESALTEAEAARNIAKKQQRNKTKKKGLKLAHDNKELRPLLLPPIRKKTSVQEEDEFDRTQKETVLRFQKMLASGLSRYLKGRPKLVSSTSWGTPGLVFKFKELPHTTFSLNVVFGPYARDGFSASVKVHGPTVNSGDTSNLFWVILGNPPADSRMKQVVKRLQETAEDPGIWSDVFFDQGLAPDW